LKNKTAAELLAAQMSSIAYDGENPYYIAILMPFKPMFGDEFMPLSLVQALSDGNFNKDIKLMTGHNEMEGELFAFPIDVVTGRGGRYDPYVPAYPVLSKTTVENDIQNYFINDNSIGIQIANEYTETFTDNPLLGVLPLSSTNPIRRSAVYSLGDYMLTCPTILFGGYFVKYFGDIHQYRLTYANTLSICKTSSWAYVTHADDLVLIFGQPFRPVVGLVFSDDDRNMSKAYMDIFTYFAKNG
jgi:carboxylesterase type B